MRQTVCKIAAVPEGQSTVVSYRGSPVAIFCVNGDYFALADRCPHAGASLAGGNVQDGCVSCPWHGWPTARA
jgi:nitrite reductase (NADH) small subunit